MTTPTEELLARLDKWYHAGASLTARDAATLIREQAAQLETIVKKNAPEIAKLNEYLEGQRLRILSDSQTIASMREQLESAKEANKFAANAGVVLAERLEAAPDLTLLASRLNCGPNTPYAKLLEVAGGAVKRAEAAESRLAGVFERTRERAAKAVEKESEHWTWPGQSTALMYAVEAIRSLQPESGEESVAAQADPASARVPTIDPVEKEGLSLASAPALIPGLERAAEICEAEKVDADATGDYGDHTYNTAIDHCIDAIRAEIERLK